MKLYGKVIGFIFLLLSFSFLPSYALADDAFSPGSDWQEIPAYGPELAILTDWQEMSSDNNDKERSNKPNETSTSALGGLIAGKLRTEELANAARDAAKTLSNMHNQDRIDMMTAQLNQPLTSFDAMDEFVLKGNSVSTELSNSLIAEKECSLDDNKFTYIIKVGNGTTSATLSFVPIICDSSDDLDDFLDALRLPPDYPESVLGKGVDLYETAIFYANACGKDHPSWAGSVLIVSDFDPNKPGLESKFFSPLIIDTDHSGTIALDGGTIQFDIAPHLAGLETIPVPAAGKDMFLVWDKAGTETIEGTAREYKEGEIIDITELFGPEDYSRSDFSKLAYTDDGFTKLAKLCDVNKDGRIDKQDTALSAKVAAKLKLWSPLSGELILLKDTDIVIDARACSYERHPSDIEGWAVEHKMKDAQDNLVGYQWLTSKTGSLLCVDVLLAIQ